MRRFDDERFDVIDVPCGSGGGKDVGGDGPKIAKNTLFADATVRLIDVIGAGHIGGLLKGAESVLLDGVPLKNADGTFNFKGVQYWERKGAHDQSAVRAFPYSTSEVNVSQEVTHVSPKTFSVTDDQVDDLLIKVSVSGFYVAETKTGNIRPAAVTMIIQIQPAGAPSFTEVKRINIKGKTDSTYERMIRIDDLSSYGPAPWNIKVVRDTPDPDEQDRVEANTRHVTNTFLASYSLVLNDKFTYPDVAYVAIKAAAKQFGSKIPVRGYVIRGRDRIHIPSNYNPVNRTYDPEIWDGTFTHGWTDNPAWVFYDLASDPLIGLKCTQAQIDKWTLYEIAKYCDEAIPSGYKDSDGNDIMRPRFTCNVVLNSQEEAIHLLNALAGAFCAMTFWGSGLITFAQDAPSEPTHLATTANVVDGKFAYQGTALTARHSVAFVTWNDPLDHYRAAIEVVEDPDLIEEFGWNKIDVVATGCTNRSQAHYMGQYILETEKGQTDTVTFRAGFDFFDCFPGAIIEVADPAYAGVRFGGRIDPVTMNLLKYSTAQDQSYWTKGNATVTPCPDPPGNFDDGPFNDKLDFLLQETVATGYHQIYHQDLTKDALPYTYTVSWFLKKQSREKVMIRCRTDGSNFLDFKFDLNAGTFSTHSVTGTQVSYVGQSKINLGNGWYRVCCTFTVDGAATAFSTRLLLATGDDYTINYTGDGTSGVYIYQAQLVVGEQPLPRCYTDDEANPSGTSTTIIPLDAPVKLQSGQTYTLSVVLPDKSIAQGVPVVNSGLYTQRLRLTTPLSVAPLEGAIWVLSASNCAPRQFRVLANTEASEVTREIVAIEHNPNKFLAIEQGIVLDEEPASLLPSGPLPKVTGFKATLYQRLVAANHRIAVLLSWVHVNDPRIIYYDVDWRHPDGTWHAVGTTMSTSIDFYNVGEPGTHEFRIQGRGIGKSDWTEISVDISLPDPPTAVTNLVNKISGNLTYTGLDCRVKWDSKVGEDGFPQSRLLYYKVKVYNMSDQLKHTAYVKGEYFNYTHLMNDEDFDPPARQFQIGVTVVDIWLQESPENRKTFNNAAPDMSGYSAMTALSNNRDIIVDWSSWTGDKDVTKYDVLLDSNNPPTTVVATRSRYNERYVFSPGQIWPNGTGYYLCIKPYDVYGAGTPSPVKALTHAVPPDIPVGSLKTVYGDSTFPMRDCRLVWGSVVGVSGFPASRLKCYRVRIRRTSDDQLMHTAYPTDEKYAYTWIANDEDFATPARSFKVCVAAIDIFGQAGNEITITASNTEPSMSGFSPTLDVDNRGIHVDWSAWSAPKDILRYKIYIGLTNPPTTLRAVRPADTDTFFWARAGLADGNQTWYVKIVPCDVFGDGTGCTVGTLSHDPRAPWEYIIGTGKPEDNATVGADVGVNLMRADGSTLVTEGDLFLNGLWARTITLSGAAGVFRSSSAYPRFEITKDRICGYKDASTKEFEVRAIDGKAYAGAGAVILDSLGVTIEAAGAAGAFNKLKWVKDSDHAVDLCYLYSSHQSTLASGNLLFYGGGGHAYGNVMVSADDANKLASMQLRASCLTNSRIANIQLLADPTVASSIVFNAGSYDFQNGIPTFNRDTVGVPFAIGTNAQGYKVTGLNADQVDGKDSTDFFPVTGGSLTGTNIQRDVDNSGLNIHAGTAVTNGAAITMYGRDHASYPGNMYLTLAGYDALTSVLNIRKRGDSAYTTVFSFDSDGNFGLNKTVFGTSAAGVMCVGTGTAPTTQPVDAFQMYSKDVVAGNACPHFRTEGGDLIRLFATAVMDDIDSTAILALTTSVGTAGQTIVDVGTTFNQTYLNNNFKRLADQVNNLRTVVMDVRTKFNALIDKMQNLGLMASA